MYKKLALLLFIITFFLGGSGNEPGRYYGDGYSIKFPKEWEKKKDYQETISMGAKINMAMKNPEGKEYVIVMVGKNKIPDSLDIKTLSDKLFNSIDAASGFDVDDRGEAVISNQNAYWGIISFDYLTESILFYNIAYGQKLYSILCSAPEEQFSDYISVFEEIAEKSFRFEE